MKVWAFLIVYWLWFVPVWCQVRQITQRTSQQKKLDSLQKSKEILSKKIHIDLDSLQKTSLSFKQKKNERLGRLYQLYASNTQEIKNIFQKPRFLIRSTDIQLHQQIGNRIGEYPIQIPPTQTRIQAQIKLDVFNVPIIIEQFWSSAQTDIRQPMNRLSVQVDWQSYQERLQKHLSQKIHEVKKLMWSDDLQKLEKLSQLENLLGNENDLLASLTEHQDIQKLAESEAQQQGQTIAKKEMLRLQKNEKVSKIMRVDYQDINKNSQKLKDSLLISTQNELKNKQHSLQNKSQDSTQNLLKSSEKENKKHLSKRTQKQIDAYLKAQKMTAEEAKRLIKWRDSLQNIQSSITEKYETIKSLEKLRNGEFPAQTATLQSFGVLGKFNPFIQKIRQFQIGTTNPIYSPLTLQGIPLNGLHSVFQLNQWHFAVSGGQTLRANPTMRQFNRRIYAGSIGYGKKEKSHIHWHFIRGEDDKSSFRGDSLLTGLSDTTFYNKPRLGYVLSTDMRYFWKKKIDFKLEIAQSLTSLNAHLGEVKIDNFFYSPINQLSINNNYSTSLQRGWAMIAELQTQITESSTLQIKSRYIEPSFFSLGLPYLRNDMKSIEIDGRQYLANKKIILQPNIAFLEDNILQRNIPTTRIEKIGLNFNIAFPKLPQISIGYQNNKIKRNNLVENIHIFQAQASKNYKIKHTQHNTIFQYTFNNQPKELTENQINNLGISTNQWLFRQECNLNHNWRIYLEVAHLREQNNSPRSTAYQNGAITYTINNYYASRWLNYKATIHYTAFGIWETQITSMLGTQNTGGNRSSIQLQSKLQWDYFSFHLSYLYNDVNTPGIFNYIEEIGSIGMGYKF